jgi:hypothetical protein
MAPAGGNPSDATVASDFGGIGVGIALVTFFDTTLEMAPETGLEITAGAEVRVRSERVAWPAVTLSDGTVISGKPGD